MCPYAVLTLSTEACGWADLHNWLPPSYVKLHPNGSILTDCGFCLLQSAYESAKQSTADALNKGADKINESK